jgi:hypothetical protein
MSKYFSIITDQLTDEQEREMGEKFRSFGWWHWLPNYWLIADLTETLSAVRIRDMIREINSSSECFVLEMTPITWASQGTSGGDERRRTWLRNNWPPEGG